MEKLRGAIVGCGMISEFHLKAWNRIPEVEITTLVSRNFEHANKRQQQYVPQAKIYTSYTEMLEREHIDFVDILTPPGVHKEYILLAREKNLHIICQKPICDNISDAREVVRLMENYPKLFAIHENHRYRPWFRKVMLQLAKGTFGRPVFIKAYQHNPSKPKELYKQKMQLGVLLEHGTHLVDMIHALLGKPSRAYSVLRNLNRALAGESLAHVVYDYRDTTAIVDVAWKPGGSLYAGFILVGDQGEAYFDGSMVRGGTNRLIVTNGEKVVADEVGNSTSDYEESFYLLQRECIDRIIDGQVDRITQSGENNLRSLESTFAAYDSARMGRMVPIEKEAYVRH